MNWRRGLHRLYLALCVIWGLALLVPNLSRFHYVSPESVRDEVESPYTSSTPGLAPTPPPRPGWHSDITGLDAVWILALALVFPGALYVVARWVFLGFRSA